jgi:predicted TIM-barrel fold metal-dependent hydrolase
MNQKLINLLSLPKIDSHCHVLDPARFPYSTDVSYRPMGQEIGDAATFCSVMDVHNVKHALLVGPNSGYGLDNRCLLDTIANGAGRFKGIAVVPNECGDQELHEFARQGVIGVAFNPSMHGVAYYANITPLLRRLAERGMWAQFQVQDDQLIELLPMIERSGVRIMFDHCGRPSVKQEQDILQKGFQALLALGRTGQAVVKLSGFAKFSAAGFPFVDVRPVVQALAENFSLQRCVWASDWPYLKAPYRLDYTPMIALYADFFSLTECEQIMWHSAKHLFDF